MIDEDALRRAAALMRQEPESGMFPALANWLEYAARVWNGFAPAERKQLAAIALAYLGEA